LAGQLLALGLTRGSVAAFMALPALIAALLLLKFSLRPPDIP
jgi:hypothetical protein